MKDKHFIFFESYHAALSKLPPEGYGRMVKSIAEYYFNGVTPTFEENTEQIIWALIAPILAKSLSISSMRAEAGSKGKGISRNVGNKNALKYKTIQNNTKTIQNNTDKDKDKEKDIYIKENITKKRHFSLPLKERQDKFKAEIQNFSSKYSANMLKEFYNYWAELEQNKENPKMRFEMQKTFEVGRRLVTWYRNSKNK